MSKVLSVVLVFCVISMSGCASFWAKMYGGGFDRQDPLKMKSEMSEEALALVNHAYNIGAPLVDHHLHVLGNGQDLTEFCPSLDLSDVPRDEKLESWINPDRFQFISGPGWWFKTRVLMDSMNVDYAERESTDQQSLCRLENLVRGLTAAPGERSYGSVCASSGEVAEPAKGTIRDTKFNVRVHLLAIDGHYDKKGVEFIREKTDIYISNWYVIKLAECLNSKFSDINPFVPVVSVNPYRVDAIKQLEGLKKRSRYIKWVPPAMGFDPSDTYNNEFYRHVRKNGQVLMSHTGGEQAFRVRDPAFKKFGDPMLLQRALDFGIPVILAHAGGQDVKPPPPEPIDDWYTDLWEYRNTYDNNKNFIEMMASEKNRSEWCLFGDISALTIEDNFQHFNAFFGPDKKHFRYRMVYGSEYPLVATRMHYPVKDMIRKNLLDDALLMPLEEIFNYNPLAFDVAVKRLLKAPVEGVDPMGAEHLPHEMFMSIDENIRREHSSRGHAHYERKQCRRWYDEHGKLDAT